MVGILLRRPGTYGRRERYGEGGGGAVYTRVVVSFHPCAVGDSQPGRRAAGPRDGGTHH